MEKEEDNTISTVKLKRSTIRKLNIWKQELYCKSIEELIDRILRIVPASELQGLKSPNNQKGVVLP